MSRPSPLTSSLLVALLCLIWGSTWLVIQEGLEDLPPEAQLELVKQAEQVELGADEERVLVVGASTDMRTRVGLNLHTHLH